MLEHRVCRQCGAENLAEEPVCFACGASAKQRRAQERPPQAPWVLYVGASALLALFAVVVWYVSRVLAGYREQAEVPVGGMLLLAVALALFGQYAFLHARRQDRSLWELKRAPRLPLKGAGPGDDVWLRGTIACDTPLEAPYLPDQQCIYYQLVVRERDQERDRGWRITQREVKAVDFSLQEGDNALYVPSGDLTVEAPVCVDSLVDDSTRVKVSALLVGWQVSLCGRVMEDSPRRRLDRLSDEVSAVVTCQYPDDYLADVSKSERRHRVAGWLTSIAAGILLLAAYAKG